MLFLLKVIKVYLTNTFNDSVFQTDVACELSFFYRFLCDPKVHFICSNKVFASLNEGVLVMISFKSFLEDSLLSKAR